MKARALRRSHTSSTSPGSSASPSHTNSNSSTPSSSSVSAMSSWIHLRSILFVVANASPAHCSHSSDPAQNKSPWARRRKKHALSPLLWRNLFTPEGKLRDGGVRLVKKVRSGGVHPSIRAEVWPFLLGVYDLNSTKRERDFVRNQNRREYENLRKQCRRLRKCTDGSFSARYFNPNIDSPCSEDAISAQEYLSHEKRNLGTECLDDLSSALLKTDDCLRRVTNADAFDLNSESSDSDSSEDSVIIQPWSILEGRQGNNVDISSKENACPSRIEVQSRPGITEESKLDKHSGENISISITEVRSKLGITEGNNDEIHSGTEVQSKPYATAGYNMHKLPVENISITRTSVQSRLCITRGKNDVIPSVTEVIAKGKNDVIPSVTEVKCKAGAIGGDMMDSLSKEDISTFGTEVLCRLCITERNNDEILSGTEIESKPCTIRGNVVGELSKNNISTSGTEVQSSLCITENEESYDEIPSKDNASHGETEDQSKFCNAENFATWQRIIRVDAVRANSEWIPYSPYQATVSNALARCSAEAVGLRDYDHLEPSSTFHAARLVAILEAYALYDPEIGYCQGMSDLLSPIISVITDDYEAFWCFVGFMRKARHNFRLDEMGIRRQLNTVSKIIKSKDSHLYRHLEKLQAEDCFFVYRMVVVLFRRELTFEQTLCLWEVMWADQAAIRAGIGKSAWSRIRQRAPPTDDLLLYAIAASVLQRRKLILEKHSSMDEILRECNNMEGQLDVWKLLDDAHHLVVSLHDKIETSF